MHGKDVPLGLNLCTNLLEIQEKTGINAKRAVERIVCFDYSNIAIDMLIKQQKKSREKDKDSLKENILQVEYEVHDARALPYKDAEFHVVTDKGTLDAMLSDKETGKKSCIKIISEASRVLAADGEINSFTVGAVRMCVIFQLSTYTYTFPMFSFFINLYPT